MVRQHNRRPLWLMVLAGMTVPTGLPNIRAREAEKDGIREMSAPARNASTRAALPQSLTGRPGDAARGQTLAADARKGNCIICHAMPMPAVPADAFGDMGPSLAGVGARLSAPALRQRVVDPRVLSPDTLMPAYFATTGFARVQAAYAGKTILSAEEVEDIVAYLVSLR